MKNFKNKVALVTGASSGIGEAIAIALASAGATVILTARDLDKLEAVRLKCLAAGGKALVYAAEVSDEAQMQMLADKIHAQFPALDILVNNAGVVMGGFAWEVETTDWKRLLDINVMGVVYGIRAFVPKMIERGQGGHVVNMGSVSGLFGAPGMGTYSASKFAVVGLSESLRLELHRHKIGVSVVCPGFVDTPIQTKVKMVGSLNSEKARARVARDFEKTSLKPEAVAQRTLRAILNNEGVAPIGKEALLVSTLKRWAPVVLERFMRD